MGWAGIVEPHGLDSAADAGVATNVRQVITRVKTATTTAAILPIALRPFMVAPPLIVGFVGVLYTLQLHAAQYTKSQQNVVNKKKSHI